MTEQTENKLSTLADKIGPHSKNVNNTERVASTVAGGALVALGIKQGGVAGTLLSILGGGIVLRGTTGYCPAYEALGIDTAHNGEGRSVFGKSAWPSGLVHVTRSVTIERSPEELYQYWKNLEGLPNFMEHLESVTRVDEKLSHWKAKAPLGSSVEWDAELTSDQTNRRLGWKSVEGADIANSGVVEFKPTKERGTEVKVTMTYESPGGKLGELFAKLFGEEPGRQVADDLRRFKRMMETGMIITTEGQPSGREAQPERSMAARAR